ncbi:MAG: Ig-like domain-containing protein [Patescibacteria group bacterium]|nr:Ig-like domain-containing protein [Patescibacteria group bacterium]
MFIQKNSKKIKIALIAIFAWGAIFLLLSNFALAQTDDLTGIQYGAGTGLSQEDPRLIAAKVVRVALGFLGILAVVLIIYGGWMYMTSEGNEEKVKKAIAILKNAAIGLIIILSAFAIVSFIIGRLAGSLGGTGTNVPGGTPGFRPGFGALGNCSIDSVYPEDGQLDVARNYPIVVTFKEAIDPTTICSEVVPETGLCAPNSGPTSDIKIFKQVLRTNCLMTGVGNVQSGCNLVDVVVSSSDNKTFVFRPTEYLGSASEKIWYIVRLTDGIQTNNKKSVFANCRNTAYFEWQFEVGTLLDLTPPQVKDVFPVPDGEQDTVISEESAVAAVGSIVVNGLPQVAVSASYTQPVKADSGSETEDAKLEGNYSCTYDGDVNVSINNNTASVTNVSGFVSGDSTTDNIADISCGLILKPSDGTFKQGDEWKITLTSPKEADTLKIGNTIFTFSSNAGAGKIVASSNEAATAANIAKAINDSNLGITATSNQGVVTLAAKVAGVSGNNISVTSLSNANILTITNMSGGKDKAVKFEVNGRPDEPMNATIQINFNEPIMPNLISGQASAVANYIKIVNAASDAKAKTATCAADAECKSFKCVSGVCTGDNDYLEGEFYVSPNGYKTVEFKSDKECGVNACGQKIYCLPARANLRVELKAASLQTCAVGSNDCATKSPYSNCVSGVCKDNSNPALNYPVANTTNIDGVVDMALNSLDGNRNGNAEGPVSFYELTEPISASTAGDNFQWSFFVGSSKDTNGPAITATTPANASSGANLSNYLIIKFNKLLRASTLKTGSTQEKDETQSTPTQSVYVENKNVNLISFSSDPLGYWITKEDLESDTLPQDGYPDLTEVYIKHSMFSDMQKYRGQAGSGVQDIYQNCFMPASGPACPAGINTVTPSCCSGTATASSTCP